MSNEPTRTQELSEDACWALLRSGEVARLTVIVGGHPEIFPINYVVDRGAMVFRTAEGTKTAGALADPRWPPGSRVASHLQDHTHCRRGPPIINATYPPSSPVLAPATAPPPPAHQPQPPKCH